MKAHPHTQTIVLRTQLPKLFTAISAAALLGLASITNSPADLPPEAVELMQIEMDQPLGDWMKQVMENSKKLADMGQPEAAADLRVQMLDHFPGGFEEPYEIRPLGELWGIQMGEALQRGQWRTMIDWYREAGKYRKLVDAYEKVLRDPYDVFREWEIDRHHETIEGYREQIDSVFLENLNAPGGFYVEPEMEVSVDVVNTHTNAHKLENLEWAVFDAKQGDQPIASGEISVDSELAPESRRSFTFTPAIEEPGAYRVEVSGPDLTESTEFAFTAISSPKSIPADGGELIAHTDAILTQGAEIISSQAAADGKAVRFPGRAHFEISLEEDITFYLLIENIGHTPHDMERTTWDIWIDGNKQTPSGMHGSGPIHFVQKEVTETEHGTQYTSLWRVPVHLSAGVHTIEISLSLDQELDRVRLVPAITDRVVVKEVRCAAPFGMFYPEEEIDLTMVLENLTDEPVTLSGEGIFGLYRQRNLGGWESSFDVSQLSHAQTLKLEEIEDLTVPAKGTLEIPITYNPELMGHFGVTYVLHDADGGMFVANGADFSRIFRPVEGFRPDSFFFSEMRDVRTVEFAGRLGIKWGRWGRGEDFYDALRKHGIYSVKIIMGTDPDFLPEGRRRGSDVLPSVGAMFNLEDYVYDLVKENKDVIGAVNFFNEPWEGKTYWAYGSRGDHYRRTLQSIYRGVKRADPDIQVIANDDSHNVRWNLLAEPGMENYFDGASIHYGGITRQEAPYFQSIGKDAWNTEFWFAEKADDTQVVAQFMLHYLHGYRMLNSFIPFWGGNVSGTVRPRTRVESNNGRLEYVELGGYDVGSIASVHSAMIHFLEDTIFREVLTPITVPWVFTFEGNQTKENKNTAVLLGHLIAGIPASQARDKWTPQGDDNLKALVPTDYQQNQPGRFIVEDPGQKLSAFDILGNPIDAREGDQLILPVSGDPIYLTHEGSYEEFTEILRTGHTEEHWPYEIMLHDFTQPLHTHPTLRVKVQNLYPQKTEGSLTVEAPSGITLEKDSLPIPSLEPGESVILEFPIQSATANQQNEYPFTVKAVTSEGDTAALSERLSVSTAVYGTIEVDGNVEDWDKIGAIRQYLSADAIPADAALVAHNPFDHLQEEGEGFFAEFATAWDEDYFYAMARIHDPDHTWEISNFNDYERYKFFPYPNQHVYRSRGNAVSVNPRGLYVNIEGIEKGEGYKRYPEDVFDPTDWRYRIGMFRNSDYDFVAYDTREGGELFRYRRDDFFYLHPFPANTDFMRLNCQVPDGKVAVKFDPESGIATYEMAIPWSEMDKIHPEPGLEFRLAWLARQTLSSRLEWARGRSTTVMNAAAFEPEYNVSWSVETPWGLYKK